MEGLWVAAIIGIIFSGIFAFIIAILFNNFFIPKIHKIYEINHVNIYLELIDLVNHFDKYFERFYLDFEIIFGKSLGKITEKIEIDEQKFLAFKVQTEHTVDSLDYEKDMINQLINEKIGFINPITQISIKSYLNNTINYVYDLLNYRENNLNFLEERLLFARRIMFSLKEEKIYKNLDLKDNFTKRWNECIDSEGLQKQSDNS